MGHNSHMSQENLSRGQFEQLDMFKPAKELRAMRLSDAQVWLSQRGLSPADETNVKRSRQNVMKTKVREAKKSGLYDSIKESGVQTPVGVSKHVVHKDPLLIDGHHRVASAMSINPNMLVPVTHW